MKIFSVKKIKTIKLFWPEIDSLDFNITRHKWLDCLFTQDAEAYIALV